MGITTREFGPFAKGSRLNTAEMDENFNFLLDLASGTGATGPTGPQGVFGPTGPAGATGASGPGSVISVAALTIGTTGSDLSSTVANSTSTPVITLNVPNASAANRGVLTAADWTTFNNKQAALVSGTNIKTINGTTLLGSGDLVVGGGGGGGIHALVKPQPGYAVSAALTTAQTQAAIPADWMTFYPFIPAQTIISTQLSMWSGFPVAGATSRVLIYSDLNGVPNSKLFESATLDGSTSGLKTITNTFTFTAGTTYWLCVHGGAIGPNVVHFTNAAAYCFATKKLSASVNFANAYYLTPVPLGSAPDPAGIITAQTINTSLPNINISVS